MLHRTRDFYTHPVALPPGFDPNDQPYFRTLGPLAADKYAYTMSSALFEAHRLGVAPDLFNSQTTFQMFVRQLPKTGLADASGNASRSAYLLTAGAAPLGEWLSGWRFSRKDLAVLGDETTATGQNLYSDAFLQLLARDRLRLSIDAMPDGELAFEREPVLRVTGPFYQCLMVEAMILNTYNACSNFATLAAQVVHAAQGRPISEQGLRRSQDIGGLAPAYGGFIGGVASTSNYLARKYFNIPAAGTMAHALVMVANDELEAFAAWAQGAPDVAVFLVDTFDTLEGVRNAIRTCQKYGIELRGVRLDSGDLGYLAKEARTLLDAAGCASCKIYASNDLDPAKIDNLLTQQKAPIDFFACGTWLASAAANPALGGVYKLARVWDAAGQGREVMKFSEERGKATLPGALEVLRTSRADGQWSGDVIVPLDAANDLGVDTATGEIVSVDPNDAMRRKLFTPGTRLHRPVQPFWHDGQARTNHMDVIAGQARAAANLARLDGAHRRLVNPHRYVAGLERGLNDNFTHELERNYAQRQAHQKLAL